MPNIKSIIKSEFKSDIASLAISQALNKLHFLQEAPELELEMVRQQYAQKGGNNERYGLHASAILASEKDFCYREQVLSLFFKQAQGENIPVGLKRIFTEGTFIGEKWQRLFLRGGLGKPEWMDISQFKKQYDLSFTPDAIVVIGKTKYVVEIKSQNTFAFKHAKSHPSGRKQLKLYMWLTGIHNGFVLVEDKNTQEFRVDVEEHVPLDIEPYAERLEQIQIYKRKFIDEKKPPKRICKKSTCKRAEGCNMRDACFNIGMGRKPLKCTT